MGASHASDLEFIYLQRPPFSFDKKGVPQGLIVELTKEAATNANLSFSFRRIDGWTKALHLLKKKVNACNLGSYKTPEREKIYKYTQPIYKERPYVVVTNKKVVAHYKGYVWLDELLASQFVLGLQNGFSYGAIIDKKLGAVDKTHVDLNYIVNKGKEHDERHVFNLINKGRIDYLFLNEEEYLWNKAFGEGNKQHISHLVIKDNLDGINRYLMCSMSVDDKIISSLNQAITKLRQSDKYQTITAKYLSL
jgi:polar amino acid transport system substrate-binding protein